jgi:maltose O-acetyltransferase
MQKRFKYILIKLFSYLSIYNIKNNFICRLKGIKSGWTEFGRGFYAFKPRGSIFGENVEFGDWVRIQGSNVILGDNVYIGHNNHVYGKVIINDYFMSGPNVAFIGGNHGTKMNGVPFMQQTGISKGIEIGKNVWVGCNSVITDGVKICDNVVIGAGSVVVNNIDKSGIYVGNPTRLIKK